MRLILYPWYFFRSVYYRGFTKTLRLLAAETRYEKLFNVNTLSIKASDNPDNFHYQGASYLVLLDVLKRIPASMHDKIFVDYGSGKGRALFCAEFTGFNKLLGVELDAELIEIANENVKHYSRKRKQSHFSFVHQNAVDFKIPSEARIFYFFNPFGEKVMKKVIGNILEHHKNIQENIIVVYLNPKYHKLWIESGFSVSHTEISARYREAVIYTI